VYTLLIAALAGIVTAVGLISAWDRPILSTLAGLLVFLAVTLVVNLLFRKKIQAVFEAAQKHILDAQEDIQRQVRMIQAKNLGASKGLQKQLEKAQEDSFRQAIAVLDDANVYERWNFLVAKQANTLRARLYYQMRDNENTDRCFDNILPLRILHDPLIAAMRLVRLWKQGKTEEMKSYFKKAVKVFKDDKATLLYAAYSWILVKDNFIDEAIVLLDEGKESTENETLRQNWDHLVNGRTRRFSNAGLGEQWYALLLEEPKQVRVRQGHFGQKVHRR
jgi:tetratricopeptide (TPR) repeat protein